MKKIFVKKIIPVLIFASFAFIFSSCQEVVFDNIRKEVQLESGTISGDIRSIIRFKDNYYLANGGIYYKNKDYNFYGAWIPSLSPSGHVIKLAADEKFLYALVGVSKENEKEGTNVGVSRILYYSEDGKTWTPVSNVGTNGTIAYTTAYVVYTYLFCTNSINPANRSAYFVLNDGTKGITNKAYKLNGATATELELEKNVAAANAGTKPFSTPYLVSRSCVNCNGEVRFFSSNASTTNETNSKPATIYYYGFGAYLRWGGAKENAIGIACNDTIQSLGITSDYILIGTNSGIKHNILSDGVPGLSVNFLTNAASTLSAAYQILSILVVNPESEELKTPIYASQVYTGNGSSNSAQFSHVGLWAYYPSRGNWNRE